MALKILDVEHPFFRPLWRRVAIVAFCLGWSVIEFTNFTPFWGALFGAIGLYCGWQFFVVFDPDTKKPDVPEASGEQD